MPAASQSISVMIVDDHPLLREGISAVLATQSDIHVVAEAENGRAAIESFRSHRPDITLMDLRLPDINGIEAIEKIRADFPNARIVVLTTYKQDVQIANAIKAGASGFLLKTMLRLDIAETIRAVHAGHRRIAPEIAIELADNAGQNELTAREIEVLRCVAAGKSNKIVAGCLTITEETVKAHMRNILSKLGANDRTHAAMIAVSRGFIDA